jgi:arylsulfatase A-like enzyme
MAVIFVLIDGLRPDAIATARCVHIDALCARGAATMSASSVMPSITLPCHTSIFHSVPPSRHGITTNTWTPMARPLPGLFDVAHAAGLRCASFYNWEELRDLNRPGSLALSYFRNTSYQHDGDDIIVDAAAALIAAERPEFAFVYLGTVDVAGHHFGWMSDGYLRQVERVDAALGRLLESLADSDTVLLQSDHGGHERSHGLDIPEDMTIPWIIAGPGIRRGHTIEESVSLLDTAPTLARVLGLTSHGQWEGRCVEQVFDGSA